MSIGDWGKTIVMQSRLQDHSGVEVRDGTFYYQGRHIINRYSSINGGVCMGEGQREAFFIDFDDGTCPLASDLYGRVIKDMVDQRKGDCSDDDLALRLTYEHIKEAMPFGNVRFLKELLKRFDRAYGLLNDKTIPIDAFIANNVAVCRHYAVASAGILERLSQHHLIDGTARVNRNSMYLGGHAWCRYERKDGQVDIVDIMQEFQGPLKDSLKDAKWFYSRPDDDLLK